MHVHFSWDPNIQDTVINALYFTIFLLDQNEQMPLFQTIKLAIVFYCKNLAS